MTPKITKHWIVLSKHGKNLMGWKLPGRQNGAEKMLEPNSHGCDLLQQLDKDKKEKKKSQTALINLDGTPDPPVALLFMKVFLFQMLI